MIIEIIMNRSIFVAVILIFQALTLAGQKYYSKVGRIHFLSEAPLEKIEASNNSAYVVLDAKTGVFEWSVLIKGFQFAKDLMQTHFNENYMESHTYPKGLFKGNITNMNEIKLSQDGSYKANVKGELTLHGVTKPLTTSGLITVKGGKITASSTFEVVVAEYNIEIPKVVKDNIAKTVKVTVGADLLPLK